MELSVGEVSRPSSHTLKGSHPIMAFLISASWQHLELAQLLGTKLWIIEASSTHPAATCNAQNHLADLVLGNFCDGRLS